MRAGEKSDSFWVLLMGEATAQIQDTNSGYDIEVARLRANDTVGEVGLMLEHPRTESVVCQKQTYALRFDRRAFDYLSDRVPGFSTRLSKLIADRLLQRNLKATFPVIERDQIRPTPTLIRLIPSEAMIRHRLIPISQDGTRVLVGFVDPPGRELATRVRTALGELELEIGLLRMSDFDRLVDAFQLKPSDSDTPPAPAPVVTSGATLPGGVQLPLASHQHAAQRPVGIPMSVALAAPQVVAAGPPKLNREIHGTGQHSIVAKLDDLERIRPILERMPSSEASDLHLSAHQLPRWRIAGDLFEIPDFSPLGSEEILDLFEGLMPTSAIREFNLHHDCDFAFEVENLARFRVNVFRDGQGVSAVLRLIPLETLSMDKLGLPVAARAFANLHQGLILVCGPTGSGKSTTLAALIDHINTNRPVHVITLEDPIEYAHKSKMAKVTQREVGKSTTSFARGLRASLREDPDIVLVGELRDRETLELALQTAQTGHLVFGTLHTSTAVGTVDRVIDMFPVEQHTQVRSVLADMLKGVINQHLCKRIGGGRVAAYEVLIGGSAVSNCIRQAKTLQIATIMTTNRNDGHRHLNDELFELVRKRQIEPLEAIKHSEDHKDMKARLGMGTA
jgi:twitching motility protein PilT